MDEIPIGGAVQVVSKAPVIGEGLAGNVGATLGNYGLYEVNGAINIPLGDRAAFRLAAKTNQRDGYSTNYLVDDSEGYVDGVTPIIDKIDSHDADSQAVRASFAIDIGEAARLDLSHYYSQSDTNGALQVAVNGDIGGGDGVINARNAAFGGRPTAVARSQYNQDDHFFKAVTDVRPFAESKVNISIARVITESGV